MSRVLSLIGYPMGLSDAFIAGVRALFPGSEASFHRRIAKDLGARHVFLMDSGIACFLAILETLQGAPRREIVLPAYTAPSLVVALRQEGFVPVLVDVSLDDLGGDVEGMVSAAGPRTAAVVATDMFGIPSKASGARHRFPKDVLFIEDACQAFGARGNGCLTGTLGDVGFWSFNRGKNFSGGCLVTGSDETAKKISFAIAKWSRPRRGASFKTWAKSFGVALAFDPNMYGMVRGVASRFKENDVPGRVSTGKMGALRAALGERLWGRRELSFRVRHDNGEALRQGLSGADGLRLPSWGASSWPVFNRFPVLIDDPLRIERVEKALLNQGIETSRLYGRPLHHIFDLGYPKGAFGNAVYVAHHLLTLPVHARVTARDVDIMINVIKK
jgi:dTDP-4-amino-4,6-dideoxygalactose transaminase